MLPLSDVFRRSSLFWGAGPRDGKFLLLKVDLGLEIVKGNLVLNSGEGTLSFFFFFARISGACNVTTLKLPQSQCLERDFKRSSRPCLCVLAVLSAYSALPSGTDLDLLPSEQLAVCPFSHLHHLGPGTS